MEKNTDMYQQLMKCYDDIDNCDGKDLKKINSLKEHVQSTLEKILNLFDNEISQMV